ncbi:hypothetical protein CcaverHIS002_0411020 [Cutaneotrichosporon cavernicola]|uniref:G-patch domain-containing protein n=1 Tax=Cutaneotrichosporon cavernicola TaxID=279322 RepID=A0AA48L5F1_9TREE|nr:uncharacterized protein CcaverHIS019_0410930 [Cutaneotrichosporon cavernicola]BEI84498.1 hypothetical protein CcaverHIS002_0411020 [Cutaneotrichosporon cavernicola]BEI92273.1 hypothetical protein CcaverHIS019_0410930 [Cutaneotrichosporon cavernicola]BEJ00045.1 hypothetical protein CcaverHIS631_0410870 [Cutaneotrichosporon cavernicola]BEJ07817.1 hypothetical protein CcaverHIS641_0410860 [Cutaneotrichosporon cavernicola]
MSDSEDDFMSDKYLVETSVESTYSSRRRRAAASGAAKAKANETLPLREREAAARREGLNRSLFEGEKKGGQAKAMDLMQKMGWSVGEGLGRRRSASPERAPSHPTGNVDREREGGRAGIGAGRGIGASAVGATTASAGIGAPSLVEPIRISMWAGRRGLAARSPSPPPPPKRGEMSDARARLLDEEGGKYRGRWGAEAGARDAERKEEKARELLIEMDGAKSIKFHPLHASRDPEALPKPLLRLLYPETSVSPGSSPAPAPSTAPTARAESAAQSARAGIRNNVNKAEALRDQMRRDMLTELGEGSEDSIRFGVPIHRDEVKAEAAADAVEEAAVDWESMVRGTRRVLAMSADEHLAYLVSQLRNEHMFCFWCGSKYSSFAEMDGPGGCPGEEEDDH